MVVLDEPCHVLVGDSRVSADAGRRHGRSRHAARPGKLCDVGQRGWKGRRLVLARRRRRRRLPRVPLDAGSTQRHDGHHSGARNLGRIRRLWAKRELSRPGQRHRAGRRQVQQSVPLDARRDRRRPVQSADARSRRHRGVGKPRVWDQRRRLGHWPDRGRRQRPPVRLDSRRPERDHRRDDRHADARRIAGGSCRR